MQYFDRLRAHLATLGVPDMGTAAVQVGDSWVVVDYNCDGRLVYYRTQAAVYHTSAPFMSYEGGALDNPYLAGDLEDFLECRWVSLD